MPKRKDKEEEEDATDPKTVKYWDKLKKGEGNLVDAELKKADSVLILKWFTKGSNAAWKFFKRVYLKKPDGKAGSVTKWAYCVNHECASECRFLQAPRSTTSGLENHPCNKEKIAQKKKYEKAKKASKDAKALVKSVKSTKIGEIKTLLKESVVDMTIEHGTSFRLAEGNGFAKVVQCGARVGHILGFVPSVENSHQIPIKFPSTVQCPISSHQTFPINSHHSHQLPLEIPINSH